MRLSHQYLENIAFVAGGPKALIDALGKHCDEEEAREIWRLAEMGLPPIISLKALSVMTGFNAGFLWSVANKPEKYYRVFSIPKGRNRRQIEAPKVALKVIQKWLSIHFGRVWKPVEAVHGFVPGKSHISAANQHVGAKWVASVDIKNFFPSTPVKEIRWALAQLGYSFDESLVLLTSLCRFEERLSQGAPTSPVLSNIALNNIDVRISKFAAQHNVTYTRYADDIVLSGAWEGPDPDGIFDSLQAIFNDSSWTLSSHKKYFARQPARLKVHGLLVHGERVRLTKGYRNRIRAYAHLERAGRISVDDVQRIRGHLNYARQVEGLD